MSSLFCPLYDLAKGELQVSYSPLKKIYKQNPGEQAMPSKEESKETKDSKSPKMAAVSTATFSKIGRLIPENAPVVDVKDIMMYKSSIDEMDTKNLVPYVIYLDEQFKDVVKKKKRDALAFLIVKIIFIMAAIIFLLYAGAKIIKAVKGG